MPDSQRTSDIITIFVDDEDFTKFANHHHKDIYHLIRDADSDYLVDPDVDRFFMLDATTRIATRLFSPYDWPDD